MMSPQQALAEQERLFARALEIVKVKRDDYSGPADPFLNFRQSKFWGVEPWRGAAIRLMDKLSRFQQLASHDGNGQVKDESIEDTVVDALNYVCIVYLLWREQHQVDKLSPDPQDLYEHMRRIVYP